MKIRVIAFIVMMIGLMIIFYPKLTELYYQHQQEALVAEWQEYLSALESPLEESPASAESGHGLDDDMKANMDGILTIETIDLELPVLRGVTKDNLNRSVASMDNAVSPGASGNYIIAGHRNHTYGRNFNRLEEVNINDTIVVTTTEDQFMYIVTEKLYVEPEETSVLQSNGSDREITLITCHPMINPTQRLVIKGKLVE